MTAPGRTWAGQGVIATSRIPSRRFEADCYVSVSEMRSDAGLFGPYAGIPKHYDEVFAAPGKLRPHWRRFVELTGALGQRRVRSALGAGPPAAWSRTASPTPTPAIRRAAAAVGARSVSAADRRRRVALDRGRAAAAGDAARSRAARRLRSAGTAAARPAAGRGASIGIRDFACRTAASSRRWSDSCTSTRPT